MSFLFSRQLVMLASALVALQFVSVEASAAHKTHKKAHHAKRHANSKVAHHAKPMRKVSAVSAATRTVWTGGQPALFSASALVLDQGSGDLLYEKNASAVVPIASITKLMTAMVTLDVAPNLQERLEVSQDDVDTLRNSRSRLPVGAVISREEALLLALMSSENRAAHALARHYPGGINAFVVAMNQKAAALGMQDTHFDDPTGLSNTNVSSARDLAKLVSAAHGYAQIREFSTTSGAAVAIGNRTVQFHNTNQLVQSSAWDIGVSKTGFINEAGKCLVMQARLAGRAVVIVLLDSAGKMTRIGDANRVKRWMESGRLVAQRPSKTA